MNKVFEFIKYHWNAKGRHGIHSPFVYELTDKCFKIKLSDSEKNQILAFENELKNIFNFNSMQDIIAISKKLAPKKKTSIYKNPSSKGKYGELLFQLSKKYDFKNILEFGTSLGTDTFHLYLGNPSAKIVTIEACQETYSLKQELLKKIPNISCINKTFEAYLESSDDIKFDFIFVDGLHDGQTLIIFMEKLKKISHSETIFLLDDIRWNNSMFEAWNKIISDNNYHLTVDFFRMGMIVPRPQQQKEHFILKI